jgi:hypothetical protein
VHKRMRDHRPHSNRRRKHRRPEGAICHEGASRDFAVGVAHDKAGVQLSRQTRVAGSGVRSFSGCSGRANLHCDRNHEQSDDARQSVDNKISYARVAAGYK